MRSRRVPEGKRRECGVGARLGPADLDVLLIPSAKTPCSASAPVSSHISENCGYQTHIDNLIHSIAKGSDRDQKEESIKK